MKILQVVSTPPNAWATGGCARVVYELSRQLVKMGHSVTIATTDVLNSRNRYVASNNPENLDGIMVYRFKNISNLLAWKYKLYLSPGLLLYLRKNVKDFDVVHLQDILSINAIATARYCTQYRVPYVLTTHGSTLWFSQRKTINHMIYALFGRRILEDSTLLTAVTESELAQQKNIGVPDSKIVIIPNGLDVSRFDALPRQGNFRSKYNLGSGRIVLFLGRIHKRKGIDFLVRAFGLVAKERSDCILVIAGPDDGYRKSVENLAESIGIADRVKFTSFVDSELEAYVDADMLVYPAIDEIFGLVPFEAIMCGTPVIVADDCGCGELVKKANCGLLAKYGDVTSLKEAILQMLDSDRTLEFITNGQRFIRGNLPWSSIARNAVTVYEDSLAEVRRLG